MRFLDDGDTHENRRDAESAEAAQRVELIMAGLGGRAVGIESNKVIDNTDSATTKWDIGFRGTTIITNGGNSGPGTGAAFVYVGTYSDLATIPTDSTFRADNAPTSYAIKTGSGNGWYSYNGATQLITPIPGRILVIRTATGKYAKIEIQNYYKGGVTPDATASDNDKLMKQRYYTFRYTFQSDGSKKF